MIRGIGEQTWAAADVLRGVAATGRRVGAATLGLLTGRYGAGVGQLARRGMLDQTWYTAVEALPVVIFIGWHARRRPLAASLDTARRIVSLLLAGAGLGILVPAAMQVLAG